MAAFGYDDTFDESNILPPTKLLPHGIVYVLHPMTSMRLLYSSDLNFLLVGDLSKMGLQYSPRGSLAPNGGRGNLARKGE